MVLNKFGGWNAQALRAWHAVKFAFSVVLFETARPTIIARWVDTAFWLGSVRLDTISTT